MDITLGKVSIINKGAYSAGSSYTPLNMVTNRGGAFLCKANAAAVEPGVTVGWENYWVNITQGILSLAIDSPAEGTARLTATMTDGSTQQFSFSTTAIADGSVGTAKLANGAVTNVKTDFSAGFAPTGPIILKKGVHYDNTTPATGVEGQIFFTPVDEE